MAAPQVTLWRNRSLRFVLGASTGVSAALLGVIRNKWLASHLATSGVGVLAQASAVQLWLGTAAGLGLSLPVARAVGRAVGARDEAAVRRTVATAFSLAVIAGLVIVALGLIFASAISTALFGSAEYAMLIRIAMLGVAGLALQDPLTGLFAGRSDVRAPLTLALAGGIPATALTLVLVPRFGVTGGMVAAAVLFPLGVMGALLVHRRAYASAFLPPPQPLLDRTEGRALLSIASASLVLALIDQGTLLAMRSHYLRIHGVSANGLLQAALALAQQVGALFYAYLASYAFGKVSGAAGADGIRDYTRRHWVPLVLLAITVFAGTMLVATPLLHLLYSDRFDPARPLMTWALYGEYAKVCTRVWMLGALPLGGMRLLFPLQASYALLMAAAYAVLARAGAGVLSLPIAYAVAGVGGFVVVAIAMSRRGVTIRALDAALFVGGLVVLGLLVRAVAG